MLPPLLALWLALSPTGAAGSDRSPDPDRAGWSITIATLREASAAPRLPATGVDALSGPQGSRAVEPGQDGSARATTVGRGFALPAGASLDPALDAAIPTLVRMDGRVTVPIAGRYRFGVATTATAVEVAVESPAPGSDTVRARGARWTEWLELEPGVLTLAVAAVRPTDGPFTLVPRWERDNADDRGFRAEPIPIERVRPARDHGAGDPRADRVRVGQLGCLNCHATGAPMTLAPPTRRGPHLAGIGERVHAPWLAAWIANPQDLKPGAGMPDVFRDTPADDADLEALLAYLLDGAAPVDEPVATEPGTLAQGRELYHTLGCIACHGALASPAEVFDEELLPHEPPDVPVAAPFARLADKWRPDALARFLEDPRATWPESPMPSSNLTAAEADLIATYLLAREPSHDASERALAGAPELVARGRAVFAERGCASCHTAPDASGPDLVAGGARVYAAPSAPAPSAWRAGRGCLDPAPDSPAPRYALTDRDRRAIDRYRATRTAPEVADAPLERARDAYAALNCQACHARDGRGGVPDALRPYFVGLEESAELGDEARIPPELSGVGRKLRTAWLDEVLTGAGRARPYMAARMPQFAPAEVGVLAAGLAYLDGVLPHTDRDEPAVTDELVLAGKRLMGIRGLACISCHVVGDLPPAGTPGPDLTRFAERLRYAWFRDYMHDPARFKPGTRMPQFTTKGRSAITDLWDGDAERQVDAMWAYFTLGEFLPVPDGVPKPGELALVPSERPVVFRTFLESVGSKAICVGTPSGLHYAFDAEEVRLAEVWKGAFVDAAANWTARGGGQAGGRGALVWETSPGSIAFGFADGPDGRVGDVSAASADFGGYRLDDAGAPTFVYDLRFVTDRADRGAQVTGHVEETVIPYPRPGIAFARLFAVRGLPPGGALLFEAPAGTASIGPPGAEEPVRPGGTYLTVWAGARALAAPFGEPAAEASPGSSGAEGAAAIAWLAVERTAPSGDADDDTMIFSIEVAE